LPQRIKEIVFKTLKSKRIKKTGEITLCFLNDYQIKKLNWRFRKKNTPTDVLAFGFSDHGRLCADIAVSTDTALRNARHYGTTPLYETCLYVVHGLLHVLGYQDNSHVQRKIMQEKAESILKKTFPKAEN
jgi:probable rRNA maturation factor